MKRLAALTLLATSVLASCASQAQQQGSLHESGNVLPLTPARHLQFGEHEGTWVSLDVSPDGKTITFELLGDIYEMSITGGEAHCIVGGLPFDSQPTY